MPSQMSPSDALFARAAELRAAGPAHVAQVIGPTVAAYGIGAGSTGTRADLLVCDDVVDLCALHNRIDRCRVAEYFENNLMNLLEPEGRFWGLFTPWHADDLERSTEKKSGVRALPPADWAGFRADLVREVASRPAPGAQRRDRIGLICARILAIDSAVSTSAKANASALVVLGKSLDLQIADRGLIPHRTDGLLLDGPESRAYTATTSNVHEVSVRPSACVEKALHVSSGVLVVFASRAGKTSFSEPNGDHPTSRRNL